MKRLAVLPALGSLLLLGGCPERVPTPAGGDRVILEGPELGPELGVAVDPIHLAVMDIDVDPAGIALPPGSGSVAEGALLYAVRCAWCHGPEGRGGPADPLAIDDQRPDVPTIGSYWPYATTLFDYLRRAMPYDAPGTLSDDEVYALTAHLLFLNGIVPRDSYLDHPRLLSITMPNRSSFPDSVP